MKSQKILIDKSVKVNKNNKSLQITIPNMIHTIAEIREGDYIQFHTIKYTKKQRKITAEIYINEYK